MKKLYIVGAGGFGREVAWLVERINEKSNEWDLIGFIDDNDEKHEKMEGNYPVLGGCDYFGNVGSDVWVVCAVGSAKIRKQIIEKLEQYSNVKFATLVDPSVIKSKSVHIGEGTILCAGTIATVNISIGEHVIVNLDCTIGHDTSIDDFVTIYPSVNVSGNVKIEKCVEVGTGTQIIQGKNIVCHTIIGAGAVVVKNIEESGTYVGSPAKKIK